MTTTTEKPISKAEQKRRDRASAILKLREMFPPGSTVHTSLVHVSRSGMYRHIKLFCAKDGEVINVSGMVATAIGGKWCDDGSIGVSGCGMDMGFHLVYALSSTLYPNGYDCIGDGGKDRNKRCPSNDHSNGDRDYTPHHHSDGGYALRHHWI